MLGTIVLYFWPKRLIPLVTLLKCSFVPSTQYTHTVTSSVPVDATYVCVFICMYVCLCVCAYVRDASSVLMDATCVYVCVSVCVHVCVCMYVCVCVYVCVVPAVCAHG